MGGGAFVLSDTVSETALWQGRSMHHRPRLPQLDAAQPFLTDGGLETTLIFHRGLDLPAFAAFDLLKHEGGRDELREAYPVVPMADSHAVSIGLTSVRDDVFLGVYADRKALPEADRLAELIDESFDELRLLADAGVARVPV